MMHRPGDDAWIIPDDAPYAEEMPVRCIRPDTDLDRWLEYASAASCERRGGRRMTHRRHAIDVPSGSKGIISSTATGAVGIPPPVPPVPRMDRGAPCADLDAWPEDASASSCERRARALVIASGLRWIPKRAYRGWAVAATEGTMWPAENLEVCVRNWYVGRIRLTFVGMWAALSGRWRTKDVLDALDDAVALSEDPAEYWIRHG